MWLQTESPVENTQLYTFNIEAICSSETSVHTLSTWRHTPEDGILHSHRRENLKSYTYVIYLITVSYATPL
jgi:hypothetical protein